MNSSRFVARRIWAGMLWVMRRPHVRRLQRAMILAVPVKVRPKALKTFLAQERFARRHGLPILTFFVGLFFVSFAFTVVYYGMTEVLERGWIRLPQQEEASAPTAVPKPSGIRPVGPIQRPLGAQPTYQAPSSD